MDQQLSATAQIADAVAIDHIGIAVRDLDGAIAFYAATLGLVETHRERNDEQQVTEAMLGTAAEAHQHAPVTAPTRLQLLMPTSSESAVARFLERAGPGLHHTAYRVHDLEATSSRLRGQGTRLVYPDGRWGTSGSVINFIYPKDAGGALVELVQPARIAW